MTRKQELLIIYRHTHADYKSNGSILVLREGGTHLVPIECLTEAEIASKLPYAIRKEAERKVNRQ